MIVYIGCLVLPILLYPLCFRLDEYTLESIDEKKKKPIRYYVIITLVFSLLVGLRGIRIGLDTQNYFLIYRQRVGGLVSRISVGLLKETGYQILCWLTANQLHSFQAHLIICAILSVAPIAVVIYYHSDMPLLSWFFYVAFGLYTFAFSTIRQAVAMGIAALAFLCIPKKKMILFYILTIVAASFHQTALIMLPLYWFSKLKINIPTLAVFFVVGIFLFLSRTTILNLLSEYSTNYYFTIETGGEMQFLFILLVIASIYIMKKDFMEANEINGTLFYSLVMTATIFQMLKMNPVLFRLYYYYYMYIILLLPNQIKSIKAQSVRWCFVAAYVFVGCYFFYTQVLTAPLGIIPYRFFWQGF